MIGHGQHGLQPTEHTIGAPVTRELDGGALQMTLMFFELALETLEEREGIGRGRS
jgi:hypothetical protein